MGLRTFWKKLTRGKPAGYMPVAPFIHVNFVQAFFRDANVDAIERTPEVYEHFGFDCIHRNCTPAYDWVGRETDAWKPSQEVVEAPDSVQTTTMIGTPDGDLRQTWRMNRTSEYDVEMSPTEYLIKSRSDFEALRRHKPKVRVDTAPLERAAQTLGDRGVTAPWIQGAFNQVAFYYCKLDDLLTMALTDEPLYREIMEFFLHENASYIDQILVAKPDLLSYGINVANAKLLSPAFYERYVLEYETRLIAHIQSQGVPVLAHNCGYAANFLPLYARMGMAAYESLTPPPQGDTVLEEALRILPEGTVLSGNMDQIKLLRQGPIEAIERKTREIVETVRRVRDGRNFIIAATDYFCEDTPFENVMAFSDAARRFQN